MDDKTIRVLGGVKYGPAPEASEDVQEWLQNHQLIPHFINGKFQNPGNGGYLKVFNPADGSVIAQVARGRSMDIEMALTAAKEAFPVWSGYSCQKRHEILYSIYRNLNKNPRMFARLESVNNGKPIWQSRDLDVPLAIRHFRHHAGWAKVRDREFPHHRPGGVVAQIIPWNFPLLMLAWKVAPALAAGNTVVLKPAETTPLTAMLFAEMLEAAGLPPGALNIVNGDGATGKAIVEKMTEYRKSDPLFWKIAFTGSTEVGRAIRSMTAGSGLRLSLELGGKSPFVIFDGADIKSAVRQLVHFAILLNYGQVCCAGSRLLVQENIFDEVIAEVKEEFRKLRAGVPLDKCMDLGAINSEKQRDIIEGFIQCGRDERVEVWQPESWTCPPSGFHCVPTLVTKVQPTSKLVREEIFGPVLVAMSFRTPKEAIELANNTTYGLAASVWTQDISLAHYVARMIKAGVVWNNCTNLFDSASGFGGVKESGYGREGGREGMEGYLVEEYPVNSGIQTKVELLPVVDGLDRTYRHYIGGKPARGDEGQSFPIRNVSGKLVGVVADANRKDVRNAVAAARAAQPSWEFKCSADLRTSVLYYLAELLKKNQSRFIHSSNPDEALKELETSVERLVHWGSMSDKFGGRVQSVPGRISVQAIHEPIGVIGIRAPDNPPLLGLVTLLGAAISMGNSVVLAAGSWPMQAAEFIEILENACADVPPGTINILTAKYPDKVFEHVAKHKDVDAIWCFAASEACATFEKLSISNMKRTWTVSKDDFDWYGPESESEKFLREATQVKNIWTPYGA